MLPDDLKPGTKVYWVEHNYDTSLFCIDEGIIEGRLPEIPMDFVLEKPSPNAACYKRYLPATLGFLNKRELASRCTELNVQKAVEFLQGVEKSLKELAKAMRE